MHTISFIIYRLIILIEQSSSEYQYPYPSPTSNPQHPIDSKDSEQTQGEGEGKDRNVQNKPPIKIVCKKSEGKAVLLTKGKAVVQPKKVAAMNRREQINKQLRVKVNIDELKQKIIKPGKPVQSAQDKRDKTPPPPPKKKSSHIENISFNDLIKMQGLDDEYSLEELLQANKGKVAKKGGKNDRPQQPQRPKPANVSKLSPSERHIMERRTAAGQVDLGVMSLDEVMGYCREKGLISEQFFMEYMASSDDRNIKDFIHLFIHNKYQEQWNFRRYKVTIMDHRRLAEYLVRIFPQQFKICTPDSSDPTIKDFLSNLYILNQSNYRQLLESFDAGSRVNQWKIMKAKLQKYDKIPVRVLPPPLFAQTYKKSVTNDLPIKPSTPIIKKPYAIKIEPQKSNKKRTLNSMYSDPYQQTQVFEHESRLASLKNQLRKKKTN